MSSDQIDHAKVVSQLFHDITAHTSYEKLKGIFDQNAELRDKVKKLTTTLEVNLESLHNAKAKLDKSCQELQKKDEQVQSLQKEADHIGSILTAKTHELKEEAQNITRTEDALKRAELEIEDLRKCLEEERKKTQDREAIEQELESTRHELDNYRQELKKLENFSVPLKPACTRVEEITSRFTKIFDLACDLAKEFFGADLPESSLANAALWDQLKKHSIVHQARIPLPLSNTAAAKQMRGVAALAVLYAELQKHVFQPTYLFEDPRANDEFSRLLNTMDPAKEAYLRSVLLGSIDKDVWKRKVKAKIEKVKASVDDCLGPLLSQSERTRFKDHLDRFCKRACHHWHYLQKLEDRVHYSTKDWVVAGSEAYRLLPLSTMVVMSEELPLPDETYPGEYPESPRQNYSLMGNGQSSPVMSCSNVTFTQDIDKLSTSPSPSRSRTRTFDKTSSAAAAPTTAAGPSELLAVVCPAFYIDSCMVEEDPSIISPGYGVCDSQLKTAREEEARSTGTHHAARQSRRCRDMSSAARNRGLGIAEYGIYDGDDQQDREFEHGCESTLSSFLNAGQSELSNGSRRGW
ncbi:hypothetical protein QR685DRAFT_442816 [Neurospora intermedia]|uniref:MEI5 protein n=1 Tax=Neurospora intermedia TaxID=5142 RepID=A0ABR3DHK0_NEUIN